MQPVREPPERQPTCPFPAPSCRIWPAYVLDREPPRKGHNTQETHKELSCDNFPAPRTTPRTAPSERAATPEPPKTTVCTSGNASRGPLRQHVTDGCFALQVRRSERTGAAQSAEFHTHSRPRRSACEECPTWRFQAENILNGRRPVELVARAIRVCESDRQGLPAL